MGNIIGNKAFVGNYEAGKIYLGDTLVYEKGLLFSMPSYNNTVPYVNSFGAVTFTGGTDVDGWIGFDSTAAKKQLINITPYLTSLKGKLLITIKVKWILPASSTSSSATLSAINAKSDKVYGDGLNQQIDIFIGMDASTNKDKAEFHLNGERFMIHVLPDSDRLFELGCYVDMTLKRCYMGIYRDFSSRVGFSDKLDIPDTSYNYLEYLNSLNFDFLISSTLGNIVPVNSIKDIKIRSVSNIDIGTGEITYL